ncbi:uncharacterized protein [Primulina eburnea]|uniref:uncharacterized protein isoform X3 n=1 Tax=Primulina eburnea TaxID=1245227 RepID=UPI003C6C5133
MQMTSMSDAQPRRSSMALNFESHHFLLIFSLLTLSSSSSTVLSPENPPAPEPTVYEILLQHGLPGGLLPDSVTSYSLAEDGSFEVTLKKPCYVKFEYLFYFEEKITGNLSLGSLKDLDGIQVQRFVFLWFDVDEISVDLPPSDSIYITFSFFTLELDVNQFLNVRSCEDEALAWTQLVQVKRLSTPISTIHNLFDVLMNIL